MSKSKGLEFDGGQPAFLWRLRREISGQVDDPDRHVDAVARPKRPKRLDADEDDGPTYVMEDTNATLTKEEYDVLVKEGANEANSDVKAEEKGAVVGQAQAQGKVTQKLGAIGAAKKRKAAKVIGGDEGDDDAKEAPASKAEKENGSKLKSVEKKPHKKKKAKVKIDFGDDGEI